jgi:uncharacterized membrane protein
MQLRMSDNPPVLPHHIEETVQAIAAVPAEHYQRQAPLQLVIGSMVSTAARPAFGVILIIAVAGWVLANLAVMEMGREPWDPPPFPWLAGAASLLALFTTILILATQRHDELARHREMLTLEIAILSEQKATKIIQMLAQMLHDSPHLANRSDHEAQAMADAADPHFVLDALKDAHKTKEQP